MNVFRILFLSCVLIFSSSLSATEVQIIRKASDTEYTDILFVVVSFGKFDCISKIISSSKFLKFLKVRSLSFDMNLANGTNSLEQLEETIFSEIQNNNADFVIVLDESNMLSKSTYEKLINDNLYNKTITIGYNNSNADINLFTDFNRFFSLANELESNKDIYFLHNKNNPVDKLYLNQLNTNNDKHYIIHDTQISFTRDVSKLSNKIDEKQHTIIIANIDTLEDEVSGKKVDKEQIIDLFKSFPILLIISHNTCNIYYEQNSFFLNWDYKILSKIIDDIITQRRITGKKQKYILSSKFNINLSAQNSLLESLDINKLKSLLEYSDGIIFNK